MCQLLALGGHRVLPKVANERYCNVVLILGVIWGSKKMLFFSWLIFFLAAPAPVLVPRAMGAQRAPSYTGRQPPTGARSEGPVGPRNF